MHWQYGGATNIFSAFVSLISFGFGRRITPSNKINNELYIFNQQRRRADVTQNAATSPMLLRWQKFLMTPMIFKGLLLILLSVVFGALAYGQPTEVLQLCGQKAFYKEKNIFLTKPKLEVVQIVAYGGHAIDDEYEFQLFFRVLKMDSLFENKIFYVSKDTGLIKCSFDVQSVWNWVPEKATITGTIAVIKLSESKMTFAFNLTVSDLRNNRTFLYNGQRVFLKSKMPRAKNWNSY